MTLRQATTTVRALGLTLRHDYNLGEYHVHVPGNHDMDHGPCYFTDDRDDAVGTARHMANERHAVMCTQIGLD